MATPVVLSEQQLVVDRHALSQFNAKFQNLVKSLDDSRSFWSSAPPIDVNAAKFAVNQDFQTINEILKAGGVGGRAVTDVDVQIAMTSLADNMKAYATALEVWNAGSPTSWLSALAQKVRELGGEVINFVTAPARNIKNILIWGTVAVAAIFLLPPILRTVSAYRKGGADAALDEATRRLEAGQESIRSGARRAATLTAKGAAAYATKNPAILVSGLSRHRRYGR
jgi:hypothetical protein